MWIFISKVPESTSHTELMQFINKGLKTGLMGSSLPNRNRITHCELMRITDRDSGKEELHGLAEIRPEKMLPGVIERLNGTVLHGKPVEVHKYQHRSPNKDRRTPLYMQPTDINQDRRGIDRRRHHLSIDILNTPEAHTDVGFHNISY